MSSNLKIKFDILDYKDILPKMGEYEKHDQILNADHREKGRIEKCIWQKHIPTAAEIASPFFREQEARRILKTGCWVCIKDTIVWLPPPYYFALQYGVVGDQPLQFRFKRLKHKYFKIRARNNPACKGTFTIKNRQDGETTDSMTESFWECADGIMNVGQIGAQSKTRADAINPCWMTVQTLWQSIPKWLKDDIFSDFISGDKIAEKMQFMRNADEEKGISARNILFTYYPAVYNAMDGKNNMKKCILDEVLKWIECNFGDTLTNYSKFIMPGMERRGLFDIFSSPADKECQSFREGYDLWKLSDPEQITSNGSTASRIHRYYSNPLEGIQGAYDMWGDADPEKIYAHIMQERKSVAKDKLLGEIRGFPLNEEEMWGSLEANSQWSNTAGIKARKIYLMGTRFKDEITQEPKVVYGNLERVDGYIDGEVEFRQADIDHFDIEKARFCFSYLPQNKEPLSSIFKPPAYIEDCLGIDPFNHRYSTKNPGQQSNHAMVNRKFRDLFETGINKCPTMIYCCRPNHQDVAFEDALKAAIFNRAMMQYENLNDKLANYAEDRGYSAWLLPEIGADKDSKRKGDSPTGKGKFLDEGMALIDAHTNLPLIKGDPYLLEKYWFWELLEDYLKFNQKDTHANDLTMADIQSLVGCVKIMYRKIRQPSDVNDAVMDYLLT